MRIDKCAMMIKGTILLVSLCWLLSSCKETEIKTLNYKEQESVHFEPKTELPNGIKVPEGMVWIPGGQFYQGAQVNDKMSMAHEKPIHKVAVDGFFIDKHEVTNAQFSSFVEATGYITVAERMIEWVEMKKQLPPGTPKPPDSILQPGSLIFKKTQSSVLNLSDFSQWWSWQIGANWKNPQGPHSNIVGLDDHPVVHISYGDALAYCEWVERRLPTEAEWEYAARGRKVNSIFSWGNDSTVLSAHANTWEGEFPVYNTLKDGFENSAPVMNYLENDFGLFDMAGNVWEWTSDWYNTNYYKELLSKGIAVNPKGAEQHFNPNNPYNPERVIKGGSWLCSVEYCASYRISARMATSMDSGAENLGFRTVVDLK